MLYHTDMVNQTGGKNDAKVPSQVSPSRNPADTAAMSPSFAQESHLQPPRTTKAPGSPIFASRQLRFPRNDTCLKCRLRCTLLNYMQREALARFEIVNQSSLSPQYNQFWFLK